MLFSRIPKSQVEGVRQLLEERTTDDLNLIVALANQILKRRALDDQSRVGSVTVPSFK